MVLFFLPRDAYNPSNNKTCANQLGYWQHCLVVQVIEADRKQVSQNKDQGASDECTIILIAEHFVLDSNGV